MITDVDGPVDIVGLIRRARSKDREVHLVPAGTDKAESLANFARALAFPNWFGANLDALADSLRTFVLEAGTPQEIIWDGATTLADEDPEGFEDIRSVLAVVSGDHPNFNVTVVHRL